MTTPIAEDFDDIRAKLEQIEREKAKVLTTPLPDVQPLYIGGDPNVYDWKLEDRRQSECDWKPAPGYLADYDPA